MGEALINGTVLTDAGFRDDLAVLVQDGRIHAIVDRNHPQVHSHSPYDLAGGWLLPGFIDLQVNGGGGALFNNAPTVETLGTISRAHRQFGTTAFLPTLISDDIDTMHRAVTAIERAIAEGMPGLLGLHWEGPFLAASRRGTHNADRLRTPDPEYIAVMTALTTGTTLITLAPECVSEATIEELVDRGATVSIGHTDADYSCVRRAIDAGAQGFTHLFNAMPPLQGRAPGAVGAALEDENVWCGIIVDGIHVHPANLRIALAAKPRGKVFLVTDAMHPVGAPQGDYRLYGKPIVLQEGAIRNAEGVLAGSALDMASAVRNTVTLLGQPLETAARMASTWPAEFLGLNHQRGRIAAGYRADMVLMNTALHIEQTWIDGKRQGFTHAVV